MSRAVRAAAGRLRSKPSDPYTELAALREAAYDLLGSLLWYPAPGELARLRARAGAFGRRETLARGFSFFPRLRTLLDLLERADGQELEGLEQEYLELFVLGTSRAACPPYESAYVERQSPQRGLVSVDVEHAYTASGMTLAESGELPDHAALELGFLSVLCGEERRRWREGDAEAALDCLQRQADFHDRHLGRWFATFTRRLGNAASAGGLYRTFADAAHAFVVHDRLLAQALLEAREAA
jgi:TorA maturation chaperone TorD